MRLGSGAWSALSEAVLWSAGVVVSRRCGVSGAVLSPLSPLASSLSPGLWPGLSRLQPSLSNTEQYNGESGFDERT